MDKNEQLLPLNNPDFTKKTFRYNDNFLVPQASITEEADIVDAFSGIATVWDSPYFTQKDLTYSYIASSFSCKLKLKTAPDQDLLEVDVIRSYFKTYDAITNTIINLKYQPLIKLINNGTLLQSNHEILVVIKNSQTMKEQGVNTDSLESNLNNIVTSHKHLHDKYNLACKVIEDTLI
jgi:hypothetical protein